MTKSPNNESDLKKRITAACVGLVFISETDSPVEPFFGRRPAKSKSIEIEFDRFFDRLTARKDWHTKRNVKNTDGFAKLKALLEAELDDLRVYRVGEVQIDIFVIGRDKHGKTAGVKMKAVET